MHKNMIFCSINDILINDCFTVNDENDRIKVHIFCYPFIVFRSSKYTKFWSWSMENVHRCMVIIFTLFLP